MKNQPGIIFFRHERDAIVCGCFSGYKGEGLKFFEPADRASTIFSPLNFRVISRV